MNFRKGYVWRAVKGLFLEKLKKLPVIKNRCRTGMGTGLRREENIEPHQRNC
jgi:hypothetical protein